MARFVGKYLGLHAAVVYRPTRAAFYIAHTANAALAAAEQAAIHKTRVCHIFTSFSAMTYETLGSVNS